MQERSNPKGEKPAKTLGLYEAGQFIPRFVIGENGCGVTVKLPESYRERIGEISANERYRHKVEEEIASILSGTLRDFEITVRWSARGPMFDVPGNSCGVFVDGSDREMREYVDHNVDSPMQALVLYTCLNVHMQNALTYLGLLERRPDSGAAEKDAGFFSTDILFDGDGKPSIIRDNRPADFPRKRG